MRYFDTDLIANNPRQHGAWWEELCVVREHFHQTEEGLAQIGNAASILPRDAWLDLDSVTRRVMRADEGAAWMNDLMPLARAVNIGKIVHLNRVSGDGGAVTVSISGQVPTTLDKVDYDYRGTVIPVFSTGYGREWREWNTLQSENFDALADDQEAMSAKLKRENALAILNGRPEINFEGYQAYGIKTSPYSKTINLGASGGGANIDLDATATTSDAIEAFINGPFGELLDDNYITQGVNIYISPEIARNWDRPYSLAAGFKGGSLRDQILANRRINKIEVSFELSGNEFFWFVPSSEYIRPLVGAATSTVAIPRQHPRANYQFEIWNAMGLEIRADYNSRSGVGYSTDT